ncbi:antitoxin [Arthrobacter cheniae]|uniref:Antitoxin n=1 Tax=Arthrobacter cheniae TaxID=1258888 RepID=A0A3A5LWW8_9MICC|nr:antitoxin [Arthrobacter cheniae]RJT75098.1 antitoxin [Arthrobacter cheniae]
MGLFGGRGKKSLASKALQFISNNPDKVNNGIAKAGDFANKRTHGKYSRHITGAQTKAADALTKINRKNGGHGRNEDDPSFGPRS